MSNPGETDHERGYIEGRRRTSINLLTQVVLPSTPTSMMVSRAAVETAFELTLTVSPKTSCETLPAVRTWVHEAAAFRTARKLRALGWMVRVARPLARFTDEG